MSTLKLQLVEKRRIIYSLDLPAENVIEMTLTIGPNGIGFPKLISIANIVGKINDSGFELVNNQESNKIAELITNYYTPTLRALWVDMSLQLQVAPILPEHIPYYQEVANIRPVVIGTAREVDRYNAQQAYNGVREAQNRMVERIKEQVQGKPSLWSKMPELLMTTALTALFDSIIGFPLRTLITSVLGGFFDRRRSF